MFHLYNVPGFEDLFCSQVTHCEFLQYLYETIAFELYPGNLANFQSLNNTRTKIVCWKASMQLREILWYIRMSTRDEISHHLIAFLKPEIYKLVPSYSSIYSLWNNFQWKMRKNQTFTNWTYKALIAEHLQAQRFKRFEAALRFCHSAYLYFCKSRCVPEHMSWVDSEICNF